MAYGGVPWTNKPSTASPINAANLEIMDNELVYLDTATEGLKYTDIDNGNIFPELLYGYYSNAVDGQRLTFNAGGRARISTGDTDSISSDESLLVSVDSGWKYVVFTLAKGTLNFSNKYGTIAWRTTPSVLPSNFDYKITFAKSDDSAIDTIAAHLHIKKMSVNAGKVAQNAILANNPLMAFNWIRAMYQISGSDLIFSAALNEITHPIDQLYEPTEDVYITVKSGYKAIAFRMDKDTREYDGAYITWFTTPKLLESQYAWILCIKKYDNSALDVDECDAIGVESAASYDKEVKQNTFNKAIQAGSESKVLDLVKGVWTIGNPPTFGPSNNRLATPDGTYVRPEKMAFVYPKGEYRILTIKYSVSGDTYTYESFETWGTNIIELDPEYAYRFDFARNDNAAISLEEGANFVYREMGLPLVYNKYASGFQLEEEYLMQKVLSNKDINTITFGLITDTHSSANKNHRTAKQGAIIGSICESVGASFVIHLGDVIEGREQTLELNKKCIAEFWGMQNRTSVPVLYTVAHHEQYGAQGVQGWGNDPTAVSQSECIGMYGRTTKQLKMIYSADKSSWYTDIDGVRFIGLNSVSNTAYGFSEDVIEFLQNALETENKIVLFSHNAPYGGVMPNDGQPLNGNGIINAMSEKINDIFAYFHGHTHWDNVYQPSGGVKYISTCCAMPVKVSESLYCSNGNPTAYTRELMKLSEFCFDIVNIHTDTGIINMYRFGVGSDRVIN